MAPNYNVNMDSAMKPALKTLGYFSDMGYPKPSRADLGLNLPQSCKGKQMLPGDGHIKDGTNAGYFSEFIRPFDGDEHYDHITLLRRIQLEKKRYDLDGPFNSTNATKTMNGKAMLWGTFIEEYEAFSPLEKQGGKSKKEPRGIFTNPGKKGTGYGYAGVCLNKYLEHSSNATKKSKKIKIPSSMKDRSPFYERAHATGYFDPNPYAPYKKGPEYKMTFPKVARPEKPFYPTSTPKKPGNNHDGCFNPFPKWTPAPVKETVRQMYTKSKVFMPQPGPKSTRTNSIHRQFIQKEINGKNCDYIVPVEYAPVYNKK